MTAGSETDVRVDDPPLPLRPWQATIWTGMRFGPWWRLLCRHRFDVAPARLPTAGAVTVWSMVGSIAALLQRAVHGRRIAAVTPGPDPLFILGHWRGGTTYLHELLALDARLVCPTTFECFAPEHSLVLQCTAPLLRFLLPARRPMDRMAADWLRPQEDEFACCLAGLPSPYETIAFPRHRRQNWRETDLDDLTPQQRECWDRLYLQVLRTVSYRRPGQLVLKGPLHTCRIPHLARLFPQARYIHLIRDPRQVIPSTIHLWRALYAWFGLHRANPADLEDDVFDTFHHVHARFDRHRTLIEPHRLCELRHEELTQDPVRQLRRLYEHLALDDFDAAEPVVRRYVEATSDYRPNRYTVSDRLQARMATELAPYLRRYGYT